MIVRCPSCKTTYQVADKLLRNTQPAFRCSRCKHTFELLPADMRKKPVRSVHAEPSPSAKTPREQELQFTFAPKQRADGENRKESDDSPRKDVEVPASGIEYSSRGALGERFSSAQPGLGLGPGKVIDSSESSSPELSPSQPLPLARETIDNVLSLDPYRNQPASTVPFLTLFGLLVIFFGFATVFHLVHPTLSEGIVRSIPLLGPSVLRNTHLRSGVALQSLRASRQIVQGNREVLVVTGIAQNRNPVVIREVRIVGQLYNLEGKEIEQQTIWVGNAISPRIIRGMTAQDISGLQRLKPLKTFEIPPGDSIPFTIVFLKSTKESKEFSCEVLSAEGAA